MTTEDGRTSRVAELLRDRRPLLLDLTGGNEVADAVKAFGASGTPGASGASGASGGSGASGARVRHVRATAEGHPADALLIRPDGYVAWAGKDRSSLEAALTRWFGSH